MSIEQPEHDFDTLNFHSEADDISHLSESVNSSCDFLINETRRNQLLSRIFMAPGSSFDVESGASVVKFSCSGDT